MVDFQISHRSVRVGVAGVENMSNFDVFEPGQFYCRFVRRAYNEFLAAPADSYRAKIAVAQADIMAERVWHKYGDENRARVGGAQSARAYRDFLAASECPDFQLVRDVHDGHKHVQLNRSNRQVTSASQTGVVQHGGAFDANAFDLDAFDVGQVEIVIKLDDGTERNLAEVLANVIGMWERLLGTSLA